MLNRVVHPDGNYIDYQYSTSDREPRIIKILYTGNISTGLSTYNEVQFDYKVRQQGSFSDIRTTFIAGAAVTSRYLLDKITVKAEGATVRSYTLKYGNDGINSYLKSVQEAGTDGSMLNPTIFKYGDKSQVSESGSTTVSSAEDIQSFSGDFNGDGKSDLLTATVSENKDDIEYFNNFKIIPVQDKI